MMLPTRISVSLAPGSYFFCACAAVAVIAATAANPASAIRRRIRAGIVLSPCCFFQVSQVACTHASTGLFRDTKQHCCFPPIMIDAWAAFVTHKAGGLELNRRIGPRRPRLGDAGFRAARWLAARSMGLAGFHQLGSAFAEAEI